MRKYLALVCVAVFVYWWFTPKSITVSSETPGVSSITYQYYEYVTGHASRSATLPLIVVMHGDGDTPQHFFDTMWKDFESQARFIALKAPFAYRARHFGGARWPNSPAELTAYGEAMGGIVHKLADRYPTRGKPILIGYSGGGVMAYYVAARHSNSFSTIIPLAGRLPADIQVQPFLGESPTVIHALHGTSDSVVSFGDGKSATDKLNQGGLQATFEPVPGEHLVFFMASQARVYEIVEDAIAHL